MRITVLGLGRMGTPMARNLAEIGHQVTLYNRTHARALELGSAVGRVATSVAAAVADTQVALTMVADDAAEEALTFDQEGLLAHLPAGAIHLCMSTIGVETSRRLAAAHAAKGQGYVAAPVFGRPGGAATRHLWIVAGGPEAQVTRCLGIFDALGRGLTRVGTVPELAHAVKLGGNLLTATMVEGLAEVLAFGEKMGMAPADFLRLMNTAIFKSPLVDSYGGLMVRQTFEPADLTLAQALRDTHAARMAFEAVAAPAPMGLLLEQRLESAASLGFGAQDLSVLFSVCRTERWAEDAPSAPEQNEPSVRPSPPRKESRAKKRRASDRMAQEALPAPVPESTPVPASAPAHMESPVLETPPPMEPVPAPAPVQVGILLSETASSPQPIPLPVPAPMPPPEARPVLPIPPETVVPLKEPPLPSPDGSLASFLGMLGNQKTTLDLGGTTHFELEAGCVWAWHHGRRYKTSWQNLSDVELAFRHVLFLRIQSHVLLQPETVVDFRMVFGGRAKVKVTGNLELTVSRAAAARLKELLGL